MSYSIDQVNASPSGDTFQIWVDQTNKAINAISTIVVSVNTHANGGLTIGNGFVEGIFGGRNLVANTIRGGTVETPDTLTVTSNVSVTGDTINLGTITINSTMITIGGANVGLAATGGGAAVNTTTSGTSTQEVDNWDKITYRAAEYTLTIKDNDANNHQISRFLVMHSGSITDAIFTTYAVLWSNTSQGDFSANANSTHVRVFLTPTSANTDVKGSRALIEL